MGISDDMHNLKFGLSGKITYPRGTTRGHCPLGTNSKYFRIFCGKSLCLKLGNYVDFICQNR